ncbi:MAG: YgiQ family radical SAM protein [Spirochaetota bacterium]
MRPLKINPLPISVQEVSRLGWDGVDIVLITGDAYVDHPSFGIAVIGRVLEAAGYRVAILSQPDWHSCEDFRKFGKPRLFFGISSGNLDSMVNKYTALKKVRNDDAYSEGSRPFMRPDRAVIVYAQRAREAYRDVPIILGGVEASLRRLGHYDYWSDSFRRSVILDAKADLLVYGTGERQVLEIAMRLKQGEPVKIIRNIPGTLFSTDEKERINIDDAVELPSYEQLKDPESFNLATKLTYQNSNPYSSKPLIQPHGRRLVVQLPPPVPLEEKELDRIYELPYTRKPHPQYRERIPAFEMIKNSVTIMRGCFGGCSFCSIALHQGRFVESRSEGSVLREIQTIASSKQFGGTISDIGGPTANMYRMGGKNKELCRHCIRTSCLYPSLCSNLNTDHGPLLSLMRKARGIEGIKHVFISSGIRMDLALQCKDYINEVVKWHTSGLLKVAPEHISETVLEAMRKPKRYIFEDFCRLFYRYSEEALKNQYIVPYLIASHPGTDLECAIELALYLKRHGLHPRQIQDFIPTPMSISTAMYYTGVDPFTGKQVYVPRKESEKRLYRALIQHFSEKNRKIIIRALSRLGKRDALKELLKLY